MSLFSLIKDHILISGAGSIVATGLLVMLVASGGLSAGRLMVDPVLFLSIAFAAASTGLGIYALNAYHDREVDKINKPSRPIPSGRITARHAFRYAVSMMALGLVASLFASVLTGRYLIGVLWVGFTLLGFAYSTPPLKLKSRHICGNLSFAAFTSLTFTISNIAFGIGIPNLAVYAATNVFLAIFVVGLITMKDFHDYDGDKAKGDITLPVKVGKIRAATISVILMIIYVVLQWPIGPQNFNDISAFLRAYWMPLMLITSFGVYMALERFAGSIISNSFSGTQYYLVILLVAYLFLRTPLVGEIPRSDLELVTVVSLYSITAFASIYLASKSRVLKVA